MGTPFFIDEWHGWAPAIGNDGNDLLFSTNDGGSIWDTDTMGDIGIFIGSVFFLDTDYGWFTGSNKVLRTTNGGNTWNEYQIPGAYSLSRVYFTDFLTGWIYDYNYPDETALVYISKDGGITWNQDYTACLEGYYHDMDFDGSGTGWLVGSSGRILKRKQDDLLTKIAIPDTEPISSKSLQVFPNPFSNQLSVLLPEQFPSPQWVVMYDLQGRQVLRRVLEADLPRKKSIEIRTDDLDAGLYLIRIGSGKQYMTAKALKVQ